ncbi:MAG: SDR family oxidoreductase [Pseudomonadota bacterium]
MTQELSKQTALITGGASGIGFECAKLLAAAGVDVVIADLNAEAAERAAQALGGRYVVGDVSVSADAERMAAEAQSTDGRLDILVHSAGVGAEKKLLETTDDEWDRLTKIDLTGSFYMMRAAGRLMADQGYGRIVVMSSTAGLRGGTGRAAYGAAKGGLNTLVKVMAVELAEDGVTVNALAPGAIETALVKRMHSDDTRKNYRASIPMNRYGLPEEVAEAAFFLASPNASYITGVVLPVDGGFIAAGIINR